MKDITYLLDSEIEFQRLVLYEINHTDKIFYKILFSSIKKSEDYILRYDCFPLYFYGYGYLSFTFNRFEKLNYNIAQDFEIYEWRMKLPSQIRNSTNLGYYYEMHGYEFRKKII